MAKNFALLPIILLALVAGCTPTQPQSQPPGNQQPDPPLDPALRAAANQELSSALHASDPLLRVHALEGIRDSNGIDHKDEILAALNDSEARVRFAAALAAGELRIQEAKWPLLSIADDPSENVRVAVRFALHKLGYKNLSHDLEKMAGDPNPLVRGNTAFVLGILGEPSALKILRVLDKDPEAPVRQQAAEAMWRLGDEEGLKELIGMTVSSHPDDQMIAYLALAQPRNTRVSKDVEGGLAGEDGAKKDSEKWSLEVPLVAARAMGMLGSDQGIRIAARGALSVDPNLRTLASLALGAIGRSDMQFILKRLVVDPDPNVRIAAATAILQLKPPG